MYSQGIKKNIELRPCGHIHHSLNEYEPLLQRIFSSRGIHHADQLQRTLKMLPSPWLLTGMDSMVTYLLTAIERDLKITVVADFDADGATSCALALRGLHLLGAKRVDFVVPNRFVYGYGLTVEIVELVKQQHKPAIILTVDNGISSLDGVKAARQAGIQVLITDHHLPGNELPEAEAIVNPNLPDDAFPSKNIAGVGVMFYVLMALRSRLREQHWFQTKQLNEPNLAQLLDLVALGTVADVVALDQLNRSLVHQGLQRIRCQQCTPGIKALLSISGRQAETLTAADLGFAIAPRINAAGRMDDMSMGIQCLLSDDPQYCSEVARQLDELNRDRKDIEEQMKHEAMKLLVDMQALSDKNLPAGVCLFNEEWHQGVIGILAARIKDRIHRPVIAFAPTEHGEIKGSARSIPGVHIRDVLSEVAAINPKILSKFGGHAMAAGLSIKMHDYPPFALLFDQIVAKKLEHIDLQQKMYSDGELSSQQFSMTFAETLQQIATWGQQFPEPVFNGLFDVIQCRIVGQQHLRFVLRLPLDQRLIDAIGFFVDRPEAWLGCRQINAAFKLDINEYKGNKSLQLILQYFERVQ